MEQIETFFSGSEPSARRPTPLESVAPKRRAPSKRNPQPAPRPAKTRQPASASIGNGNSHVQKHKDLA